MGSLDVIVLLTTNCEYREEWMSAYPHHGRFTVVEKVVLFILHHSLPLTLAGCKVCVYISITSPILQSQTE